MTYIQNMKDWMSEKGNELLYATRGRNCWRGMTVNVLNAQDNQRRYSECIQNIMICKTTCRVFSSIKETISFCWTEMFQTTLFMISPIYTTICRKR